jgi:hypothetical protein
VTPSFSDSGSLPPGSVGVCIGVGYPACTDISAGCSVTGLIAMADSTLSMHTGKIVSSDAAMHSDGVPISPNVSGSILISAIDVPTNMPAVIRRRSGSPGTIIVGIV